MKALFTLAALPDRPSAVVCSNDLTAIGVMRQSFDHSMCRETLGAIHVLPLTAVQLSQIAIAERAFNALLDSVEFQYQRALREACAIEPTWYSDVLRP